MGSFNTSCMVSQQIIVPGTETIILPIHQQATYNPVELYKNGQEISKYGVAHTTCYPTAFWGYAGPMIRGQYDDYGRFELFDTPENCTNLVSFFNELLQKAFNTKAGENSYHDHAFNMSEIYDNKKEYSFEDLKIVWDKVWEVTHENRLFIADARGNPLNLQFAVIHHAAFTYLLNHVNNFKCYSGEAYEQKSYFNSYVNSELKRMVEIFKDKNKDIQEIFSFFASQMASLSNYRIGEQSGCYLFQHYDNWSPVVDAIMDYHDQNPDKTEFTDDFVDILFELHRPQIEHRYLHMGLDMFDIKLSPMVYASQDYVNATGKAYAKMVKAISTLVTKEIKDNQD